MTGLSHNGRLRHCESGEPATLAGRTRLGEGPGPSAQWPEVDGRTLPGRRGRTFLGLVLLRLALVVKAHRALVHAVSLHAVLAAKATRVVWGDRRLMTGHCPWG